MIFQGAIGSKLQFLSLLSDSPFEDSSTLNVQDLVYDLRVAPLVDKCMSSGRVPTHPFVVTKATCYKEPSHSRLGHQHVYVLLKVQPHHSQSQPPWSHTYIKLTVQHDGNSLLTRLGLSSKGEGTSAIVDGPVARDKVIYPEITWPLEKAPSLFRVTHLFLRVNGMLNQSNSNSCHILAAAIMDAIHDVFVVFANDLEAQRHPDPDSWPFRPFIHRPYSLSMRHAAYIAKRATESFKYAIFIEIPGYIYGGIP